MITIYLNDKPLFILSDCSLYDLLLQQNQIEEHSALVLNKKFVPKSLAKDTFLKEGDHIDLIIPMQGG